MKQANEHSIARMPPNAAKQRSFSSPAPAYIKLEKYEEVLNTITELSEFIQNLKYVFDIAEEADAVRSDAIRVLRASLNKMERSVHEVDTGLVKPTGWKAEPQIDSTQMALQRLQAQLSRLRKDVEYFGSDKQDA